MSEPTPPKTEHKAITVALIGAFATIVVALIALVPNLLTSPPEKPTRGRGTVSVIREEAPSRAQVVPRFETEKAPAEPATRPLVHSQPTPAQERPAWFGLRKSNPPKTNQPPITISFRKSKILGQGMVIGLTNASKKETLKNIVVVVKSREEGEHSHRVARSIRANDSIAVGWRELRGWKLKPEDRVKITVDGYPAPIEVVIPRG
jgi:hypothetical protein